MENMMSSDECPVRRIKTMRQLRLDFKETVKRMERRDVPIDEDCWTCLEESIGLTSDRKVEVTDKITLKWIKENAFKVPLTLKIPMLIATIEKGLEGGNCVTLKDRTGSMIAGVDEHVLTTLRDKLVPGTCLCIIQSSLLCNRKNAILTIGYKSIICITSKEDFENEDLRVPTWNEYIFFKKKNAAGVSMLQLATVDYASVKSEMNVLLEAVAAHNKTLRNNNHLPKKETTTNYKSIQGNNTPISLYKSNEPAFDENDDEFLALVASAFD